MKSTDRCLTKEILFIIFLSLLDQRLSHFIVGLLIGLSVLLAEALKHVPFAVLFGVFLYMGFTSMNGNQFLDRIWLLLMPIKHYPRVSYTRKVYF